MYIFSTNKETNFILRIKFWGNVKPHHETNYGEIEEKLALSATLNLDLQTPNKMSLILFELIINW